MAGGPKNGLEACWLSGTDLESDFSIAAMRSIAPTFGGTRKSSVFGEVDPTPHVQGDQETEVCYVKSRTGFETNLTQRHEGAGTQRVVANDSLRPSGFALIFMLCLKHRVQYRTKDTPRKKCQIRCGRQVGGDWCQIKSEIGCGKPRVSHWWTT